MTTHMDRKVVALVVMSIFAGILPIAIANADATQPNPSERLEKIVRHRNLMSKMVMVDNDTYYDSEKYHYNFWPTDNYYYYPKLLEINFDDARNDRGFGYYWNRNVEIRGLAWYDKSAVQKGPLGVDTSQQYEYHGLVDGMKSSPNAGGNNPDSFVTIACPEGRFDMVSMCLTPAKAMPMDVVFFGTRAYNDRWEVSVSEVYGMVSLPANGRRCMNFDGFSDLVSLIFMVDPSLDGSNTLVVDDIRLRIKSECNVAWPPVLEDVAMLREEANDVFSFFNLDGSAEKDFEKEENMDDLDYLDDDLFPSGVHVTGGSNEENPAEEEAPKQGKAAKKKKAPKGTMVMKKAKVTKKTKVTEATDAPKKKKDAKAAKVMKAPKQGKTPKKKKDAKAAKVMKAPKQGKTAKVMKIPSEATKGDPTSPRTSPSSSSSGKETEGMKTTSFMNAMLLN